LNTPEFRHLSKVSGVRLNGTVELQHGITQDIIDVIYDDWMQITDSDIKKSSAMSSMVIDVKFELLRNKETLSSDLVKRFMSSYERDLKVRVKFDRFVRLFFEVLVAELVKSGKKSNAYAKVLATSPKNTKEAEKALSMVLQEKVKKFFKGTPFGERDYTDIEKTLMGKLDGDDVWNESEFKLR
jgi:hypothetical protein